MTVVYLILYSSTSVFVSTEADIALTYVSVYQFVWYELCFSHTLLYHISTQWDEPLVFQWKNTHFTSPSFHCDQIAKRCLTEWGWRVAYSTIKRCQKACVERDFHLTVTEGKLLFSLTSYHCVARTPTLREVDSLWPGGSQDRRTAQ